MVDKCSERWLTHFWVYGLRVFEELKVMMFGFLRGDEKIDPAQGLMAKEDLEEAVAGVWAQGDGQAGESLPDVVSAVAPGDFPLGFHGFHNVVIVIFNGGQCFREGAGAGAATAAAATPPATAVTASRYLPGVTTV